MDLVVCLSDNHRTGGAGDSMLIRIVDDVLEVVGIGACTEEESRHHGQDQSVR